jgi:hypothetical protein
MLETNEQTNKWEKKRIRSNYIGQAADRCLFTGTKYSGISHILATNHKNIKISEMTLSCSKLMRLNELPMRTTRYFEGSVVPSIIGPNVYILHANKTKKMCFIENNLW